MNSKISKQLFLLAFAILNFATGPVASSELKGNQPEVLSEECLSFVSKLPEKYRHGWVEVPEDYSRPEGNKINVFWYTQKKPSDLPVALFTAGPVFSSHMAYPQFEGIGSRYNIGFIYSDFRGTGCSGKLPQVVDTTTAQHASLYSTQNIAKDYEEIRKVVLGENQKWTLFGEQLFGSWVSDRYLVSYSQYVENIYNYGNITPISKTQEFETMMLSQRQNLKELFTTFPDLSEKVLQIRKHLTSEKCLKVNEKDQVCGTALLALFTRSDVSSETQWVYFPQTINEILNCTQQPCLFNEDWSLNQAYMDSFIQDNKIIYEFWWGQQGSLTIATLFRGHAIFDNQDVPSQAAACRKAKLNLSGLGIDLEKEIPINECDLLEAVYSRDSEETLGQIFKQVPNTEMSPSKVISTLLANPTIQYRVFFGSNDLFAGQSNYQDKGYPEGQFQFISLKGRSSSSYLDAEQIWQNLSGLKDRKLLSESSSYKINDAEFKVDEIGRVGGSHLTKENSGITAELVYVGLANQPLSSEVSDILKGKIALVDRGGAPFTEKVKNILAAGATGFVIANNSQLSKRPFSIGLADLSVPIPGVMISTDLGGLLRTELKEKKIVWTFLYNE